MVTEKVFIPAEGLIEFLEDGTATRDGILLSPEETKNYRRFIDDFLANSTVSSICDYKNVKE